MTITMGTKITMTFISASDLYLSKVKNTKENPGILGLLLDKKKPRGGHHFLYYILELMMK